MGFLPLLLLPCLIAGVRALDLAGTLIPVPSGSPLPVPSPPSNPPPSSSTPLFNFDAIPQLTTCESATFNWTYSDSATQQQLILAIVTDRNVSSSAATATPIVNRIISSTVDPKVDTYTWPAVDVPEGWYKLYATVPARSFNTTSADFFVKTGSDVSCLLSSSSSSTTSSSSRPSIDIAAIIVGGVVGGAAALLLSAALIFLLYRRCLLDKAEPRNIYPADNSKRGRGGNSQFFSTRPTKSWDNLGSVDSHAGAVQDGYSSQRLRYQHRHPISQTSITDSVNLPVLEYSRNLSQKSFNGDEKEKSLSSPRDSVLYLSDGARSRRPSDTNSLAASSALSHVMGPPTIPEVGGPPYYRSPSPTQTVPGSLEAGNALDLVPQQTRPHKSRKATRKPVPAYDLTTDAASSSSPPALDSVNATLSSLQIADDPFARPLPAALIHQDSTASLEALGGFSSAPSSAHGHGHYLSRSQSTSSRKDRGLAHKGSFGFEGRPMHYLIPDMPLPQK